MFSEYHLERDNMILNYAVGAPGGPPLLLLHGVTRCWQSFLPLVPALATRWQVWGLDFRGHGRSSPQPEGRYLVADYLEDADAALDAMPAGPVVVLGHSLGAMVAAALAARRPERVRAVVLEDPPMHTMGRRIAETPWLDFSRGLRDLASSDDGTPALARRLADLRLTDPRTGAQTRLGDTRDAASLRFTAHGLQWLDPDVLTPIVESRWLDGYDIDATFRRVRCPVLLVQADPTAGGALTDEDARHLASLPGDVAQVRLDGVGHLVHGSYPQRLANLMHSFLEAL
jgi:pimeloyl-ACP methyl ester carboxylesterase